MTASFDTIGPRCYSLEELAREVGARIKGDPRICIGGLGSLEDARADEVSFVSDERYRGLVAHCRAAAFIVPPALEDLDVPLLIVDQPYLAMARVAQLFFEPPYLPAGVHDSAVVGDGVELGSGVSIGPLVHLGAGSRIGEGTRVYGGAYLGCKVEVGAHCLIYPNATVLDRCKIGDRVIINSGTIIGSDGFGFAQDENGQHVKIPQVGIVQIDDDVEIGANCTIDRAAFGRTWIQRGSKIDNLVQIAHNVVVGEHSILIAQVGVSGSTRLGKHVVLAGQVGVVGHIEIGDGARVGAQSGVGHSVKAGIDVAGSPVMPVKQWRKVMVTFKHLPELRDEIKRLQRTVRELEKAVHGE